ncbi:MAG: hypothetical protein RMY34_32865 [Aulosira sp. DedQUE10]|nr:hypothetical protein [Aulosira sp. DedQUE10]
MHNINEELFTEITPEQAETVEGGKRIDILTIRSIQSAADSDRSDEVFFVINGQRQNFGNPISLLTRGVANAGISANFNGSARVTLFDKDGNNQAAADSLGSFSASQDGTKTVRVSGSGSTYELTFRVGN